MTNRVRIGRWVEYGAALSAAEQLFVVAPAQAVQLQPQLELSPDGQALLSPLLGGEVLPVEDANLHLAEDSQGSTKEMLVERRIPPRSCPKRPDSSSRIYRGYARLRVMRSGTTGL